MPDSLLQIAAKKNFQKKVLFDHKLNSEMENPNLHVPNCGAANVTATQRVTRPGSDFNGERL